MPLPFAAQSGHKAILQRLYTKGQVSNFPPCGQYLRNPTPAVCHLPTEIDHEGNIFRRAACGRGWEGGGFQPSSANEYIQPSSAYILASTTTLLVLHGWGVLPGRMHNESNEPGGWGVLLGSIVQIVFRFLVKSA